MSYRPIRRATRVNSAEDGRLARAARAVVPAFASLLLVAGPAFARPHGSPDLTPPVFLPRHPDFELLSQVGCLSGPCASGSPALAQASDVEEVEPAPAAPAPAEMGVAGPAEAPGTPSENRAPAALPGAEALSPALAAGAAGAAQQLFPATSAVRDETRSAAGANETIVTSGDARAAGSVAANETLVPTLPTGGVADNTVPEGDDRAVGELVVASLPDTVELGAAGAIEDNTADGAETESPGSGLMALRGRQAALDEALGVGGFGQSDMLGLRRLSVTSPGTIRSDAGSSRPLPPRTALRDLATRAGPSRSTEGPMDSDERQAVHRHAMDRRPDPEAGEMRVARVPGASEPASPAEPAVPPAEPAPAAPRAPASAPGGGAGMGTGGGAGPATRTQAPD
jgi:hypothetical protein